MGFLIKKIDEIRNSDEEIKKRWLIGCSAITMIVVIVFWLAYINSVIKPANQIKQVTQETSGMAEFWQIFKNGAKIIGGSVKNEINKIIPRIGGERTVEIR